MKGIDVRDQVRLPLGKCVELVLSGVKFRLFRAAITVGIIALAAAFLMNMLGESMIGRQVARVIGQETAPRNNFLFWASRVEAPLQEADLNVLLREVERNPDRGKELLFWGSTPLEAMSEADLTRLAALARRQRQYEDYFAGLDAGQRRPLVGSARGAAIFEKLQSPEDFGKFREELRHISWQLPTSIEDFQAFLDEWARTRALRERILAGHRRAVEQLKPLLGDRTARELLADGGEDFRQALVKQGFRLGTENFKAVAAQAALARDAEILGGLLGILRFREP